MSELRYNLISREWVIIATKRAKRPRDFQKEKKDNITLATYKLDCPFCPGNEHLSKEETFRLNDQKGWKVRSIFNKFPALSYMEDVQRKNEGLFNWLSGFGIHEVVIEHPRHDINIALMSDKDVEDILTTYKQRYLDIQNVKNVEAITIFKNHGPQAGTSVEHPHSQIIATPIVPPQIRSRVENAVRYFDVTGSCIFCKNLEQELQEKKRIILETEKFVSFIPYAALSPFTIWIFPKEHKASFADIDEKELHDLAIILKSTLQKLYYGLTDPDYNFTIRSIPVNEKGTEYFHWYLTIIPRISKTAGFELGSGMFINVVRPEESAEFLRLT